MVYYSCIRCGYETIYKARFRNHIYRKIPCQSERNDINIESVRHLFENSPPKEYICSKCNHKYSNSSNLSKHLKKCNSDYCLVKNQVNELKTEVLELKNKPEQKKNKNNHKASFPLRLRETNTNYIYLIQEREFVRMNEDIYKVGKSIQKNCNRVDDYPKFSDVIIILEVNDCDKIEKNIISEFNLKFEKTKYGNEYFKGNRLEMKKIILNIVSMDYNE